MSAPIVAPSTEVAHPPLPGLLAPGQDVIPGRRVDTATGQCLLLQPADFETVDELVAAAHELEERQAALPHTDRESGRLWGVRVDAAFRRNVEGGRPELSARQLELAWRGLDRHHRREWTDVDKATMKELRARTFNIASLGGMRSAGPPAWFKLRRADGDYVIPKRLWDYLAILYWAYANGTMGVLETNTALAVFLGVTPRHVRNYRNDAIALGFQLRGDQKSNRCDGRARRDAHGRHTLAPRTWREGSEGRTSDQGANLLRISPFMEALGGLAAYEVKAPGQSRCRKGARQAARALRKLTRASNFAATHEAWTREVAREPAVQLQKRDRLARIRRATPSRGEGGAVDANATGYRLSAIGGTRSGAPEAERVAQPTSGSVEATSSAEATRENRHCTVAQGRKQVPSNPPPPPKGERDSGTRGARPRSGGEGNAACKPAAPAAAASRAGAGDIRARTQRPSVPTTAALRASKSRAGGGPARPSSRAGRVVVEAELVRTVPPSSRTDSVPRRGATHREPPEPSRPPATRQPIAALGGWVVERDLGDGQRQLIDDRDELAAIALEVRGGKPPPVYEPPWSSSATATTPAPGVSYLRETRDQRIERSPTELWGPGGPLEAALREATQYDAAPEFLPPSPSTVDGEDSNNQQRSATSEDKRR